jgi:hypothetical protein
MKNPVDVLRAKEQDLMRVRREVEALRIAVNLLLEQGDTMVPVVMESTARQRVAQLP